MTLKKVANKNLFKDKTLWRYTCQFTRDEVHVTQKNKYYKLLENKHERLVLLDMQHTLLEKLAENQRIGHTIQSLIDNEEDHDEATDRSI